MHKSAARKNRYVSNAVAKTAVLAMMSGLALSACSPGGIVAGTIGAAGAVAGTAVDVVLRADQVPGAVE